MSTESCGLEVYKNVLINNSEWWYWAHAVLLTSERVKSVSTPLIPRPVWREGLLHICRHLLRGACVPAGFCNSVARTQATPSISLSGDPPPPEAQRGRIGPPSLRSSSNGAEKLASSDRESLTMSTSVRPRKEPTWCWLTANIKRLVTGSPKPLPAVRRIWNRPIPGGTASLC